MIIDEFRKQNNQECNKRIFSTFFVFDKEGKKLFDCDNLANGIIKIELNIMKGSLSGKISDYQIKEKLHILKNNSEYEIKEITHKFRTKE